MAFKTNECLIVVIVINLVLSETLLYHFASDGVKIGEMIMVLIETVAVIALAG